MTKTEKLFLLLGGNLGNRIENLEKARKLIDARIGRIQLESSVYQTAAWGIEDQPDFLNQAILCETEISPHEVLQEIHKIEKELKRERFEKWGSRTIDIDILFYGDRVINESDLKIPHPELENRNFTLIPLNDIAAEFLHPVLKKKIKTLLEESPDNLPVEKVTKINELN